MRSLDVLVSLLLVAILTRGQALTTNINDLELKPKEVVEQLWNMAMRGDLFNERWMESILPVFHETYLRSRKQTGERGFEQLCNRSQLGRRQICDSINGIHEVGAD
jgi:hypothetical protein